ncbi:hypothetical protein DPMN_005144 [Dreissena polymorpha]|uniref:Uncharacterized protein n=1 Tax=Dreissena polymorpha TaxID=45954 RepID=A0A9D4RTL9_DREPO|nr:hypothetical protein DPMN_005144 [Dreissena polymorpha]
MQKRLEGSSERQCPPWKGPGLVVRKPSNFLFQNKLMNAVLVFTIYDLMKPCRDRASPGLQTKEIVKSELDAGEENSYDQLHCLFWKP